ncbi:MAG: ABC transporter permease [Acidobacteriota bacterium]
MSKIPQSLRNLAARPGFAAAFIITLGLGIGANTAIFSLVNGVLLQPLPYPGAERIMHLKHPARLAGRDNRRFSFVEVADFREQAASFDEFVEFGDWTFNVLGRGEPHRASGGLVTSNFFDVLGIQPLLGRTLEAEDEQKGASPVVVLTYGYWNRVFGADPEVVGEMLDLTRKRALIVGVLPPGSHYASRRKQDFYTNYASNDHYMSAAMQDERAHRMTDVFARLAPNATLGQGQAELKAIHQRLMQEYPDAYPASQGYDVEAIPWIEELTKAARPNLLILLGTAGFVLILACANVANLTLTRLISRERELVIRAAMGATAVRLRGQLLGENLLLSVAGAGVGLLIAWAGLDLLVAYTARLTNRVGEIALDGWVLLFTLSVACGAAMLFAWLPRLPISGDLRDSLASAGTRSTGSSGSRRMQRLLVLGQLAISFTLLVGAGLLVRSLVKLYQVDPGFDLKNVLSLEAPDFSGSNRAQRRAFTDTLLEDLSAQPEIEAAAVASVAPLRNSSPFRTGGFPPQAVQRDIRFEGHSQESQASVPSVFRIVSGDYFRTIGTPLLSGRTFNTTDDAQSVPVAILNRSMAEHYLSDANPLGLRISWTLGNGKWSSWATVVAVVADSKPDGLDLDSLHTIYLPHSQTSPPSTVLVRAVGEAGRLAPQVVERIRALDPNRPVERILTLEELKAESIAPQRLNALLISLFALLALVIAAVGVFGVLSFSVNQRLHEIGIRMALGAHPRQVLRMILGEGLSLAAAGLVLGGLAAVGLSRFLQGLLFEVEAVDPVTFASVGLLLLAVAAAAALGPARHAVRVDPIQTLKSD